MLTRVQSRGQNAKGYVITEIINNNIVIISLLLGDIQVCIFGSLLFVRKWYDKQ